MYSLKILVSLDMLILEKLWITKNIKCYSEVLISRVEY